MEELKRKHKAETKQMNLDCETKLAGKKGPERRAAEREIVAMKKQLQERQDAEMQSIEVKVNDMTLGEQQKGEADGREEEGSDGGEARATATNSAEERKLSRAQQRNIKKFEKTKEKEAKMKEMSAAIAPTTSREVEFKLLASQIKPLGMTIHEIAPDGDCLYGSVAHQLSALTGERKSVKDLRELCARVMADNPAQFVPFLPEDVPSLEEFCARVRRTAYWGGEIELKALALGLENTIIVHHARIPPVVMFPEFTSETRPAFHLTYHQHMYSLGEHYNSTETPS